MLARLTAVVLSLAAHHGHHDEARLRGVADDIWRAAGERPAYCGEGDAAQYATALALVGIADHESKLHPKVQVCTYGQADPAIILFALLGPVAMQGHTKREVCSDNALASRLAAGVLARMKGCGDVLTQAQGYASGDTKVKSKAAKEIADLIVTLQWRERIFVSYRNSCLTAAYVKD